MLRTKETASDVCNLQTTNKLHSCDGEDRSRAILFLLSRLLAHVAVGSLIFPANKNNVWERKAAIAACFVLPPAGKKIDASMLINAARARRELSQSEADILLNQNLTTNQCALALSPMKRGQTIGQAIT